MTGLAIGGRLGADEIPSVIIDSNARSAK